MKPEIRNPKSEPQSRERSGSSFGFRSASGFTLIELILVMAILTMAVSVTAPALANFFRGRTLDSEARRLLAMTRSGQNRAVSEGIPIDLWINPDNGSIGLDAEASFEPGPDPKAIEFKLDEGIHIEVVKNTIVAPTKIGLSPVQTVSIASVPQVKLTHPALATIRFLPDGSVSETSPQTLRLTGRNGVWLSVTLAQDKMSYEIQRTAK